MQVNKVGVIKYINDAVQKGIPETVILKKIKRVIQSSSDFNIREKTAMYKVIKRVADLLYIQNGKLYNGQIKEYSTGLNKIEEHRNAKMRRKNLVTEMHNSRASSKVFYMSSIHSNPAKDHKDWQGKIYVDRYWRSILADDKEMLKKVGAYIRNHNTISVQEVCGSPVYLITRPYCKHFLISLDTDEVLGSSINKIRKEHPEAHTRSHNIYYRKKYYKMRERIHSVLNMEVEAACDRRLIKKAG